MGQFRVTITAMGGHGCMREIKDGEVVLGCDRPGCPDCLARELVRRLKRSGAIMESATLEHWPGQATQVTDDLLTGVRSGSF